MFILKKIIINLKRYKYCVFCGVRKYYWDRVLKISYCDNCRFKQYNILENISKLILKYVERVFYEY